MKKGDSFILVQLLEALQNIASKIAKAEENKDMEQIMNLKKGAKEIASKIDSIL